MKTFMCDVCGSHGNKQRDVCKNCIQKRLAYLREQIDGECISYGEILELQELAQYIPSDDVVLREWAGIPE